MTKINYTPITHPINLLHTQGLQLTCCPYLSTFESFESDPFKITHAFFFKFQRLDVAQAPYIFCGEQIA